MRVIALGGLVLASALLACGEDPSPTQQLVTIVGERADQEGAWRDFKADFDQGLLAAEEEVAAGAPTWWQPDFNPLPQVDDPETGYTIRFVELPKGDPIEQMHVMARVRGHNWAIAEYRWSLAKQHGHFEATDPTRDQINAEEKAAALELEKLRAAASSSLKPEH